MTTSLLFPIHRHGYGKKKINVCIFMSIEFILNQIKFDIDMTNDELLKTI